MTASSRAALAFTLSIWGVALSLPARTAIARPTAQTAAITYQGLLKTGGSPLNGSVDLQFRLFDAAGAGNQVGSTLAANAVTVVNGAFTSSLDFGALAFNGEERWLEIAVASPAGGGIGPFTTLSPRQPLTSAPYAAYALGVNGATITSLNASNIASGTINNARTTATDSNAANRIVLRDASGNFSAGTISATLFSGSGAGLTGLSATNMSSGTLADARLSSNVALLNTTQTIAGSKTFSATPPFAVSNAGKVINLNADQLDGLDSAAFLQSVPVPLNLSGSAAGAPLLDAVNTSATVDATGVHGLASGVGFRTYGVYGEVASTIGRGVFGESTAASGQTYGVYGSTPSTGGRGVFGAATAASGSTIAGKFENSSTTGIGAIGQALATTGINYGIRGDSSSTSGVGVYGLAAATSGTTYGLLGRCDSPAGAGVAGLNNGLTGDSYGGYFNTDSVDGYAVFAEALALTGSAYGGRFVTNGPTGRGVVGYASSTTGGNWGVKGQSDSTSGTGVWGYAPAATGTTYGVYGLSDSASGVGVYGETTDNIAVMGRATGATGSNYGVYGVTPSSSGRGVWGYATATTGTSYGVYGQCSTAVTQNGFAVYANGDIGASGLKPFRIDHPDDPTNKYLLHYAAESDEVINFYSGKVTLDGRGEAIVDLPAYFAKINRDPRYTLTAIGAAMPNLHVADEINEASLLSGSKAAPNQPAEPCWFRIAGGSPGMKVSWEVKAVRNDRYVQRRGAPVVVNKGPDERGTYQQPELYDAPASLGVNALAVAPERVPSVGEQAQEVARLDDAAADRPAVPSDAAPR